MKFLQSAVIFLQTVQKDYIDGQILLKFIDDVTLTSALKQSEIDMDQISFIENTKEKYVLESGFVNIMSMSPGSRLMWFDEIPEPVFCAVFVY